MRYRFNKSFVHFARRTLLHAFSAVVLWAALIGAGATSAQAQGFEVEGRVVSATDGTALPGANIVEVGTQNGTTTDVDGEFTLVVSDPNDSLRVSFIGFEPTTVGIDGRSTITIELEESMQQLGEMVVTAFGIERQQRSVGYATSQVEAAELVNVAEPNPIEMLQGKVPGLIIDPNAGGVGSASQTTIRGISNLAGDNEPLFIVDGIPIVNNPIGGGGGSAGSSAGRYGGFAGTSPLSIINPENIKNISVLKGAGAAALYGIRARDGVILITTKSGRGTAPGDQFSVQYSSTLTARDALAGFADFQDQYGQGVNGLAPETQEEARTVGLSSWGAPFAAVDEAVQFDGTVRPYANVVDREGFYGTGLQFKNALSFNGAYENVAFRVSGSHLSAEDVVPSSGYSQTTISMRGQGRFGNLTTDANVTYMDEETNDRSYLNDAPRNPNYMISLLPGNVPKSALQPGYTEDGTELQVTESAFLTNPYWAVNRFEADDDVNRILGGIQLNYEFLDWLSINASTGLDWSSMRRTTVDPYGTAFQPLGAMSESDLTQWENNTRAMLTATPSLTDNLSMRLDAGGNVRMNQFERLSASGSDFQVPFFQDISNLSNREPGYGFSEEQVNSLFGSAAFNYSDLLFVTVTGRNDWSSTLPEENNSFFYPSVSGSFVFSEFMSGQDWLSYGKLRASWAEIGGDTDPYQLFLTYSLLGTHLGRPVGAISQVVVPNFSLKPTSTRETEVGFETQFFDDRLGLDFTYYARRTTDQIMNVSVSHTSGYRARIVNTGEVENSGVELLLTATPFATDDWLWDTSLNFGAGTSEVVALAEDQDIRFDAQNRGGTVNIVQIPGEKVNAIFGTPYVRDDQGRIVVNEEGRPLQGERRVLGNGAPDWALGFTNSFSYKNVSLTILADAKWGGQLYSGTNALAYSNGLHQNTLAGRAACDAMVDPDDGYPSDGCFVPENTVVGSLVDEDGDGEPEVVVDRENDIALTPAEWYGSIAGSIAEEFIYDANYIMLRQMRISYQLPERWLIRTPIADATLSLVGRNLFYLYDSVPNVSPESSYNAAITPGIEQAGVPQTRSFGFSLSARF